MKKWFFLGILILILTVPAQAAVALPPVPDDAQQLIGQEEDFGDGLWHIIREALQQGQPQFSEAVKLCMRVIASALVLSLLRSMEGKSRPVAEIAGVAVISLILIGSADSMLTLGTDTVQQISDYGKLLLSAMTAALAAQGGSIGAAALYSATALFDTLLCSAISHVLVPMAYIYLLLAIVNALSEDGLLKKMKELCKWAMSWFFKIILYLFTGYITITGVIGGSADQAAVKATKLTISGMVPVVGGILSDASETVLVSAGIAKNALGVSGMLAVIAVAILPFFNIGVHYLLLKLSCAVSGMFAPRSVGDLLEDFCTFMGLTLAMVGSVCLMQLISAVCFLKGMT